MSDIIPLKPNRSANEKAFLLMTTLAATLRELGVLEASDPDEIACYGMEIERAEEDIELLCARVNMRRSTAALCGFFGRAPS